MKPKHGLSDTESMVKTKNSLPETKSRGIMEEVDLTSKYMFKKKQLKKSGLRTNEIKEIEPVVPLNPGMPLNPGVPLGYETYHQVKTLHQLLSLYFVCGLAIDGIAHYVLG